MSITTDDLYNLLPAIYRIRDAEQGEPLKAMISVIAEQAAIVEQDIAGLYENWFIETCDEWVVPYIGDLMGVRGLLSIDAGGIVSQRSRVANTLGYRRRKGTATMLEQLARDVTGWPARAVEFFELLGWTQNYNHVRLHSSRTPDLRRTDMLEHLDTAFDSVAHTVDVRHIDNGRGWHNISSVGLFLWRIQSYQMIESTARPVTDLTPGRYRFSPLGYDMQLFNRPETEIEVTHLAEEINVPGLLRHRPLYDELEARRQAIVDALAPESLWFDQHQPVLQIAVVSGGVTTIVPPEEIIICHLSDLPDGTTDWRRPPESREYPVAGTETTQPHPIRVAVDPVLGRLSFRAAVAPDVDTDEVLVSYSYGFSADVGGGPYNRRGTLAPLLDRQVTWQVGVSRDVVPIAGESIYLTLQEAIDEWNLAPAGTVGVIVIMDSRTYDLTGIAPIRIGEGSRLTIIAADWPLDPMPELPGELRRFAGRLDPDRHRPHLLGSLSVIGIAPVDSLIPGELFLDGLLIQGGISVERRVAGIDDSGNLGKLTLQHCTVVPGEGSLIVATSNNSELANNRRLSLQILRSITPGLQINAAIALLSLEESIIDGAGSAAVTALRSEAQIEKCTLFGTTRCRTLAAGNSIFTDTVTIERRQTGCVRFCYLPPASKTARSFRCQPRLALEQAKQASAPAPVPASDLSALRARLVPSFTSTRYGHHGYARLSGSCAGEIVEGADDGAEMGAFNMLKQPQREANLRASLDEFLRLGLEAGIIHVT